MTTNQSLSELIQKGAEKKLSKCCDEKIPPHIKDKIRLEYKIEGQSIILNERRPHGQDEDHWTCFPVAKFTYVKSSKHWKLYCADRNGKWHHYHDFISKDFGELLNEVDSDPTGIFWG